MTCRTDAVKDVRKAFMETVAKKCVVMDAQNVINSQGLVVVNVRMDMSGKTVKVSTTISCCARKIFQQHTRITYLCNIIYLV